MLVKLSNFITLDISWQMHLSAGTINAAFASSQQLCHFFVSLPHPTSSNNILSCICLKKIVTEKQGLFKLFIMLTTNNYMDNPLVLFAICQESTCLSYVKHCFPHTDGIIEEQVLDSGSYVYLLRSKSHCSQWRLVL